MRFSRVEFGTSPAWWASDDWGLGIPSTFLQWQVLSCYYYIKIYIEICINECSWYLVRFWIGTCIQQLLWIDSSEPVHFNEKKTLLKYNFFFFWQLYQNLVRLKMISKWTYPQLLSKRKHTYRVLRCQIVNILAQIGAIYSPLILPLFVCRVMEGNAAAVHFRTLVLETARRISIGK